MNNNLKKHKEVLMLIFVLSLTIVASFTSCNRVLNKAIDGEVNRITPIYIDEDSTVYYNTNKEALK
tara:strand:- start:71 stop:268 length:198 start_codon:yes stop_codon:yes gene_type:complete